MWKPSIVLQNMLMKQTIYVFPTKTSRSDLSPRHVASVCTGSTIQPVGFHAASRRDKILSQRQQFPTKILSTHGGKLFMRPVAGTSRCDLSPSVLKKEINYEREEEQQRRKETLKYNILNVTEHHFNTKELESLLHSVQEWFANSIIDNDFSWMNQSNILVFVVFFDVPWKLDADSTSTNDYNITGCKNLGEHI